jgi:hypothetical protein
MTRRHNFNRLRLRTRHRRGPRKCIKNTNKSRVKIGNYKRKINTTRKKYSRSRGGGFRSWWQNLGTDRAQPANVIQPRRPQPPPPPQPPPQPPPPPPQSETPPRRWFPSLPSLPKFRNPKAVVHPSAVEPEVPVPAETTSLGLSLPKKQQSDENTETLLSIKRLSELPPQTPDELSNAVRFNNDLSEKWLMQVDLMMPICRNPDGFDSTNEKKVAELELAITSLIDYIKQLKTHVTSAIKEGTQAETVGRYMVLKHLFFPFQSDGIGVLIKHRNLVPLMEANPDTKQAYIGSFDESRRMMLLNTPGDLDAADDTFFVKFIIMLIKSIIIHMGAIGIDDDDTPMNIRRDLLVTLFTGVATIMRPATKCPNLQGLWPIIQILLSDYMTENYRLSEAAKEKVLMQRCLDKKYEHLKADKYEPLKAEAMAAHTHYMDVCKLRDAELSELMKEHDQSKESDLERRLRLLAEEDN